MRQIKKFIDYRGRQEELIFNVWNDKATGKTRLYFKFDRYTISNWTGTIRLNDPVRCIAQIIDAPIYYQLAPFSLVNSMRELKIILLEKLLNESPQEW